MLLSRAAAFFMPPYTGPSTATVSATRHQLFRSPIMTHANMYVSVQRRIAHEPQQSSAATAGRYAVGKQARL